MAWGSPQPPALRALIAHVVALARNRDATLNRTKLVKLLYLIDVESVAAGGRPVTDVKWVFFHYGPYAFELIDELEAMEGSALSVRSFKGNVLYAAAPGAEDATEWPPALASRVNRIVDRWAGEELNVLLDHVYFETAPMRDATRGQELDLQLARGTRVRRTHPLSPAAPPADLAAQLSRWRERRQARLTMAPDDAPRDIADLPPAWEPEAGVRGRLEVAQGFSDQEG